MTGAEVRAILRSPEFAEMNLDTKLNLDYLESLGIVRENTMKRKCLDIISEIARDLERALRRKHEKDKESNQTSS